MEESWSIVQGFSEYKISNLGRVYNIKREILMKASVNNHGHLKISLVSDYGERITCSVAKLVAEAFVPLPPAAEISSMDFNQVILLDGNFSNVAATNLAWRPNWFAWKYTRQFKQPIPNYYLNLPVEDIQSGIQYESIFIAGTTEGLLFRDIWRSVHMHTPIFPLHHIFVVIRERV